MLVVTFQPANIACHEHKFRYFNTKLNLYRIFVANSCIKLRFLESPNLIIIIIVITHMPRAGTWQFPI